MAEATAAAWLKIMLTPRARAACTRASAAHAATVRRDEAARASRVDRGARPLQAEHKREASRRHRAGGRSRRVDARRERGRASHHLAKLGVPDAEEDARHAAQQLRLAHRRAVQRLVAALEQPPLLRVHRRRLGGRDAKEAVVKELRVGKEGGAALSSGDGLRHSREAREVGCVPAVRWHLADRIVACRSHSPQAADTIALRAVGSDGTHRNEPHLGVSLRCGLWPLLRLPERRRRASRGGWRAVALSGAQRRACSAGSLPTPSAAGCAARRRRASRGPPPSAARPRPPLPPPSASPSPAPHPCRWKRLSRERRRPRSMSTPRRAPRP